MNKQSLSAIPTIGGILFARMGLKMSLTVEILSLSLAILIIVVIVSLSVLPTMRLARQVRQRMPLLRRRIHLWRILQFQLTKAVLL